MITNIELQNKFNTATENSLNKKFLLDNEIREIENYVNNIPVSRYPFKKSDKASTINKSPKIFDFGKTYIDRNIFNESFYKYLSNNEPIIIERQYNENDKSHRLKQDSANQAIEIFKYYKWLRELKNTPGTSKKKPELYLNQKLLALHYLGVDLRDIEDTKSAKMLSYILGSDYENTRKALPQIYFNSPNNKVRTKDNLKKMLWLFDNEQFKKIKQTIESDIRNLK